MVLYKKVKLNSKEIKELKNVLQKRGITYRDWTSRCNINAKDKCSAFNNVLTKGVITKKHYDKYLRDLNLPLFSNFEWIEEKGE
jgi:hypothetical protein